MPRYSEEFKESIVRKMMAPAAQSIAEIHRERASQNPRFMPGAIIFVSRAKAVPADPANPENWSGADKLAVVIESAALNAEELGEYCRRKGLYPEQIASWKEAAIVGKRARRSSRRSTAKNCKPNARKAKNWKKTSSGRKRPWRKPPPNAYRQTS